MSTITISWNSMIIYAHDHSTSTPNPVVCKDSDIAMQSLFHLFLIAICVVDCTNEVLRESTLETDLMVIKLRRT